MKGKIKFLITLFTRVLTAIIIFDSIMLLISSGTNAYLCVSDLICLILISLLCAMFYIPFLADKDFSKRQWIIMNICYFLAVNITTLVFGYLMHWFSFSKISSFIALEAVIICAYSLVMFFFYKLDMNTADKMNEKLKEMDD